MWPSHILVQDLGSPKVATPFHQWDVQSAKNHVDRKEQPETHLQIWHLPRVACGYPKQGPKRSLPAPPQNQHWPELLIRYSWLLTGTVLVFDPYCGAAELYNLCKHPRNMSLINLW